MNSWIPRSFWGYNLRTTGLTQLCQACLSFQRLVQFGPMRVRKGLWMLVGEVSSHQKKHRNESLLLARCEPISIQPHLLLAFTLWPRVKPALNWLLTLHVGEEKWRHFSPWWCYLTAWWIHMEAIPTLNLCKYGTVTQMTQVALSWVFLLHAANAWTIAYTFLEKLVFLWIFSRWQCEFP